MRNFRAFALLLCVFALCVSASAVEPSPLPYPVLNGEYTFDPASGSLFDHFGAKQPFTWEFVEVRSPDPTGKGGPDTVQRMNPVNYATRDTAARVLAFVQKIAPGVNAQAVQDAPAGWFTFNAPQRSVLVYGTRLNAGLIAFEIAFSGEDKAARLVLIEIQRALVEKNKREE